MRDTIAPRTATEVRRDDMRNFGDYQLDIYFARLSGVQPTLPVDFASLAARAAHALPPQLLTYVQGGCGDELTQRCNAEAFGHWG